MAERLTKMEVGTMKNTWGVVLNENLETLESRLDAIDERVEHVESEPHPVAGIVAGAATIAAVAVNSAKPVARSGLFNLFRSKR